MRIIAENKTKLSDFNWGFATFGTLHLTENNILKFLYGLKVLFNVLKLPFSEFSPRSCTIFWSLILVNNNVSAAPAKSGPLDFPSEKSFLLFFAHEKGLGHMFQK